MMQISLFNTLTRRKEALVPQKPDNVRMYVCGPTVYDRPHLGNARSVVIYDVLYRLLLKNYGNSRVTYVRNITDVDDKINARAKERGITIRTLTEEVTHQFHADMNALSCLAPTHEPRATDHIGDMLAIIDQLIKRGHAYAAEGHVLFDVGSYAQYGQLSGRKQEDLVAGARVAVEGYKRNPSDFVLWKPADAEDDASSVFDSPYGKGRPGWHIECSAMSSRFLGANFDIHGGGADLMFPHHENEIAQSCCAADNVHFATLWVHNGFLTVHGEKMSKSLGNFITVHDLLSHGVKGEVIRFALLTSKYNEPLDWNDKLVDDAGKALDKFYRATADVLAASELPQDFLAALYDDMNLPKAISLMHAALSMGDLSELKAMAQFLGFLQVDAKQWFQAEKQGGMSAAEIEQKIEARKAAKAAKSFAEADAIRKALLDAGVVLEDKAGGVTEWRYA